MPEDTKDKKNARRVEAESLFSFLRCSKGNSQRKSMAFPLPLLEEKTLTKKSGIVNKSDKNANIFILSVIV